MKELLLLLLLTLYNFANSQININCAFVNNIELNNCNIFQDNLIYDIDADDAVNRILKPLGLPHNFILISCKGIDNALALTSKSGMRYIIYDLDFMKKINSISSNWSSISILAHEIGHHLCAHTLKVSTNLSQQRENELEADKFSGFIMNKLGASLKEATSTVRILSDEGNDQFSTHPNTQSRISSIEKGFQDANKNYSIRETITNIKTENDFLYYFWLGFFNQNLGNNDLAIQMYEESIKLKQTPEAYNNIGNINVELKKPLLAFLYFFNSINLDKDNFYAYYGCGVAYTQLNNYTNAIDEYNKAISAYSEVIDHSDLEKVYLNRGIAYSVLRKYNEAIKDFNLLLSAAPLDYNALMCRGSAKIISGLKKDGCKDLYRSCELGYNKSCELLKEFCK